MLHGATMPDILPETSQQKSAPSDTQRVLAELAALLDQGGTVLDGPLGDQSSPLVKLQSLQWVNPHLPIGWPVMPKGLLPKAAAYAKKIVRVALRWYINPLVDQQNDYNEAVAASFRTLCQEIARLEIKIFELEAKLEQAEEAARAARNADAP
jgi:hypothetical protein